MRALSSAVAGLRRHRRPADLGRAIRGRMLRRRFAGRRLLREFARAHPAAFFIEVGANDGEAHDHLSPLIRSKNWSGIMVEPVPWIFERLRENYGGLDRVVLERAAIADRDGSLPFYSPAEIEDPSAEGLPDWYTTIGSFSADTVFGHARAVPDIEQRIETIDVPALTFDSLCKRHGVTRLDLLVVDTEGYDWEILQRVDLDAYRPRLVLYEHYHLSAEEQALARRRFARSGYETLEEYFDTFCLDVTVDDDLTRTWRRLRPAVPGAFAYQEPA